MKKLHIIPPCLAALLMALLFSGASVAEETAIQSEASFMHVPKSRVRPGTKLVITGTPSSVLLVDRMFLAYRTKGAETFTEQPLKRSVNQSAVASIPVEAVEAPGVEYYIYLKAEGDAEDIYLFASHDDPYLVRVHGYSKTAQYEARKEEWNGRLSRVEANYGFTNFGKNLGVTEEGTEYTTDAGNYYHEVNLAYTYRFLTTLYALRIELGGFAHDFRDFRPFTAADADEIGPGMYEISPSIEFEFVKFFGASLLMRLGISEDGFEGGGGTSIRIGRVKGTRLDLGFEGMTHAGWRMFMKFEWDTIPHVPMSFQMDRTQWYAAPSYAQHSWGNRLVYQARYQFPFGLGIKAHGGFASRDGVVESGFVVGGGAWIDF